jgi:hypothetical protein
MKSRLLLISAILATTAGLGVSGNALSSQPDAQARAAALLSPSHVSASAGARNQGTVSPQSAAVDAHAQAAALLSGLRMEQEAKTWARTTPSRAVRTSLDAHAQAAALLSGSRTAVAESARITATSGKLDEHPAVLVAQTWNTRGIDHNTFIVGHPARLQLIAASPTEKDSQRAEAEATASTEVTRPRRTNSGISTGGSDQ